jgi:multidrug efflux system outer membrane protein
MRLTRFALIPLIMVTTLAGCASDSTTKRLHAPDSPGTTKLTFTPSTTATIQPELSIDRWWSRYDDEKLDRLITEALAHNEDLEAALARVREAQAVVDQARASLVPTADASWRTSRSQQSRVGATPLPPGFDRRATSHRASLDTSYEVDLWGRLSSTTDAARYQLLASEWARASVEWSLTAQIAESYFALTAIDRQIEISDAVRVSRQATLRLRLREYEAGTGNEFDVRRAESELTGTDASLANLARQRVALESSLTLLLGRTPEQIINGHLARRPLDERVALVNVLPQGDGGKLLLRRPDIRRAEAQLAAANADVDAARAATLPALRLSGSIGSDARSISDLFSGPAFIWSLAASATQSLFDGGRAQAGVRQTEARGEQEMAAYRKVIASAVIDLREAYSTLDIRQQALNAERDRVAALARARELAQLGYDSGAFSYLDLLDAERNWYQAQLDQVDAYRDQLFGQIATFKALGGGYAAGR